jgi:hypothetical protein
MEMVLVKRADVASFQVPEGLLDVVLVAIYPKVWRIWVGTERKKCLISVRFPGFRSNAENVTCISPLVISLVRRVSTYGCSLATHQHPNLTICKGV